MILTSARCQGRSETSGLASGAVAARLRRIIDGHAQLATAGLWTLFWLTAQNLSAAETKIHLIIGIEDDIDGQVTVTVTNYTPKATFGEPVTVACPGEAVLSLADLKDGKYLVNIKGKPLAGQWHRIVVKDSVPTPDTLDVTLYKKRFAIVEYAVNKKGDRTLTGGDVETGVCAISHWAGIPYFQEDWQAWQMAHGGQSESLWGTTMVSISPLGGERLRFRRST